MKEEMLARVEEGIKEGTGIEFDFRLGNQKDKEMMKHLLQRSAPMLLA